MHVALRLVPSVVATMMVAVPTDFAVTKPLLLTVATLVLLELHDTALLVVLLGETVAVSCNVLSTIMLAVFVFSEIPVANCGVTVTSHVALRLLPSVVRTVIVALPGDRAVTKPLLLTEAMFVLLELHVTTLLVVLLGVMFAVSCSVFPCVMVAEVLSRLIPVAS